MSLESHYPAPVTSPAFKKISQELTDNGYIIGPKIREIYGEFGSEGSANNFSFDSAKLRMDFTTSFVGNVRVIVRQDGISTEEQKILLQRATHDIQVRKEELKARKLARARGK